MDPKAHWSRSTFGREEVQWMWERGERLKQCGKCHSARYCSVECQKAHWPRHKRNCQPFTADNTVTLKPFYTHGMQPISTSDVVRSALGIPTEQAPFKDHRTGQRSK